MTDMTNTIAPTRNSHRSLAYRVAVPAWRLVGIKVDVDEPIEKVSRNELEDLFSDVLRYKNSHMELSEREIIEHRHTARMRQALLSA